MTTQITPIPQWVFHAAEMPTGYDPDADFSSMQNVWDDLPDRHYQDNGIGSRYQVMVLAHYLGIKGIGINPEKSGKHLTNAGIIERTRKLSTKKHWEITDEARKFLYHMVTTNPEALPPALTDLEFYKEHQPTAAAWIDAKMRHENGDYTALEKLGKAVKALPAAMVEFVKERVAVSGRFQLTYNDSGERVLRLPKVEVETPQVVTGEDGKKSLVWPTLNKGDNLLEAPKPEGEPRADDTTPVKEDAEVAEEAPASAPVEESKAEEASETAKPKPKRKPATKKTTSKKAAGKGPQRDANGRFVKKAD